MKIGIGLKKQAYTPEAYAYAEFLKNKGYNVQLALESQLEPDLDLYIRFMGLRPFWRHGTNERKATIHEYQSLSLPPLNRLKDVCKSAANATPAGRIFLNRAVRNGLRFSKQAPYIYRDMGVSSNLFMRPRRKHDFDLIYCGTLLGRNGLLSEIRRLAHIGLKIVVVGNVDDNTLRNFKAYKNVYFTGRLSRQELPAAFSSAKAGLNYTPNIYPFNIQTSTKTLEYCAAGLGIVSNKYNWSIQFASQRKFTPLWLEDLHSKEKFDRFSFEEVDVSDLEWAEVLSSCGFMPFIDDIYRRFSETT